MNAISGLILPMLADISTALREDPKMQSMIDQLRAGTCSNPKLQLHNNLLFWGTRIYVPANVELQNKIISELHDSKTGGRSEIKATITQVVSNFFWLNLALVVQQFVKHCPTFLQTKPDNTPYKGLLQPLPILDKIWEDIAMDFITHLPPSVGKTTIGSSVIDFPSMLTFVHYPLRPQQLNWHPTLFKNMSTYMVFLAPLSWTETAYLLVNFGENYFVYMEQSCK